MAVLRGWWRGVGHCGEGEKAVEGGGKDALEFQVAQPFMCSGPKETLWTWENERTGLVARANWIRRRKGKDHCGVAMSYGVML